MFPPLPSTLARYVRVAGANPAANNEVTDAVPSGKWWIPLSISIPLAQGATQTPQPILVIDDGANTLFESLGSSAAQAAGSTCQYTWAPGLNVSAQLGSGAGIHSLGPLPYPLLLPAGFRIRTVTLGIGANTDYGVPSYYVVELG